ncbi:hypothetical protein PC117_g17539 [Phytophthora cactorum]|nr:hypothetical protein PC117_g17539 [Phytophthora cactorum]
MKMLKKFKKIELQAGESMDVSFSLSEEDWGVYKPEIGSGLKRVVEDSNLLSTRAAVPAPSASAFSCNTKRSIRGKIPPSNPSEVPLSTLDKDIEDSR